MTKIVSSVKRHPWWLGIGLLVIGGGVWASWDVLSLALTPEPAVSRVVPTPSRLVSESGETVYRIDPESSEVTVSVVEELAGVDDAGDPGLGHPRPEAIVGRMPGGHLARCRRRCGRPHHDAARPLGQRPIQLLARPVDIGEGEVRRGGI